MTAEQVGQQALVDGLDQVIIHAFRQQLSPFMRQCMGGEGDHRQVAVALAMLMAQCLGGFQSVHARHLDIHQDGIHDLLLSQRQRLFATLGGQGVQPHVGQQLLGQQAVGGVVVDHHHALARLRRRFLTRRLGGELRPRAGRWGLDRLGTRIRRGDRLGGRRRACVLLTCGRLERGEGGAARRLSRVAVR